MCIKRFIFFLLLFLIIFNKMVFSEEKAEILTLEIYFENILKNNPEVNNAFLDIELSKNELLNVNGVFDSVYKINSSFNHVEMTYPESELQMDQKNEGKIIAGIDKLIAYSGTFVSFGINYNIEKTAFPSIFDTLLTPNPQSIGQVNTLPSGLQTAEPTNLKNIIQAGKIGTTQSDINDLYHKPGFFINFRHPLIKSIRNSLYIFPTKIRTNNIEIEKLKSIEKIEKYILIHSIKFYNYFLVSEQLKLVESMVTKANSLLRQTEKKRQFTTNGNIEVLKVKDLIYELQIQALELKNTIDYLKKSIFVSMNIGKNIEDSKTKSYVPEITESNFNLKSLNENDLENTRIVKILNLGLENISAQSEIIEINDKPDLNLLGQLSLNGSSIGFSKAMNIFNTKSGFLGIELKLNENKSSLFADKAKIELLKNKMINEKEKILTDLKQDFVDLKKKYELNLSKREKLEIRYNSYSKKAELEENSFNMGSSDLTFVVNDKLKLIELKIQLLNETVSGLIVQSRLLEFFDELISKYDKFLTFQEN